ncbi:hypothetical protein GN958_ATG19579 [Phytophthora infestans]|uniref:Protein kinase domain-containing protein n=1 Tax=Phytophthora infestans TaxID=4787 RepID=A0A8S9TX22_PHYIN|nr:hypothetical protein GN958_ATG19579 [Phytophthora infestans]
MGNLATRPFTCDLVPFVTDIDEYRTIVLVDDAIERTVFRSNSEDHVRLVNVYTALKELSAQGSSVTHLQTVRTMIQTRSGSLFVELLPVGYFRYPRAEEVMEWLQQMLIAVKYWHSYGYCHGDIRWRNIVFVPDTPSYWVLIDMDESHLNNTTAIQWNHQWEGEMLRFHHDLYQLGKLMEELTFDMPPEMIAVRDILQSASSSPTITAETVLGYITS